MESPTDTELMGAWETTVESLAAIRGRQGGDSELKRHEIRERQHAIKISWNELFQRKHSGQLTDSRYVKLVGDAAKGAALQHGLAVTIVNEEGPKDDEAIADSWRVYAICNALDPSDKATMVRRLNHYGAAVVNELADGPDNPLLIPDPLEELYAVVHNDELNTWFVIWSVKNWIWDGPEGSRELVSLR